MTDNIHSFSDFADTTHFAGKKKRIEDILDRPILVRGAKIIASKRNAGTQCLQLQFELDSELFVLFSGSAVLLDQCQKYSDKMPFHTKIIKCDKYFSFS
ncbi:MAG: hypothetical protein LBO08_02175 [Rickettsiales bacterium]|nr:hypothetical protein [Rickettsiales bacterium]